MADAVEHVSASMEVVQLQQQQDDVDWWHEGNANTPKCTKPQNDYIMSHFRCQFQDFLRESRIKIEALVKQQVADHMKELNSADSRTFLAESSSRLQKLGDDINNLKTRLETLQVNHDERVAKDLRDKKKAEPELTQRITKVEDTCAKLVIGQDSTEQQGRKETIEVHNIPFDYDLHGREDTTGMMVHFCQTYLKLNVSRRDISISHRQDHPDERKRQGANYLPSIYCKFVSRTLAHMCLERRDMIKGLRNDRNQPIFLRENLTQSRRELWYRAQSELFSYPVQWVKNGKIFVKKRGSGRSIKVLTENTFVELLNEQRKLNPNPPTERSRNPPRPPGDRRRWPTGNLRHASAIPPRTPPYGTAHRGRMPGATLSDFIPPFLFNSSYPTSYSNAVSR